MRYIEPNRWAWAEALVNCDLRALFRGIERPDRGRVPDRYTWLGWVLASSGRYMDKHCEQVAQDYMTSDFDDEWREACEDKISRSHCCDAPIRCEAWRHEVQALFVDKDKREKWARDRVDASWEWDRINEDTKDVHWVAWFLKEHPITHIARDGDYESWVAINDLEGFCQSCQCPCDETKVIRAGYDETVLSLDCSCGENTPTTEPVLRWPPNVELPRHLNGEVITTPMTEAYEEYMDAARQRRRRLREDATASDREGQLSQGQPHR